MWIHVTPVAGGPSLPNQPAVQVRPEYERALKRVYLSVPDEYRGPQDAEVDPHRHVQFVRHAYAELIASLPRYTNIDIAVSDRHQAGLVEGLRAVAGVRPFRVHVVDRLHADLDMWAQDLGERVSVGGEDRFLVPMPIEARVPYNGELSQSRQRVARRVFSDRVVEADFVFEGGNLAFDRDGDRTRVFIGYNDVRLTIENYQRQGRDLDSDAVGRLVAGNFGGAQVVVMGREQQSPFLFHLDQTFILLGNGLAVVNRIVGPPSREQRQLEATRTRLEALGYRTIAIDHTQADVEGYRVSTNAVPFVDAETGQKKIIFPVFPGEAKGVAEGPIAPGHLTGKALAAYRVYEAAGYLPIPIRDFAHIVGGNTHCITNVLN
jgi:hypothetical protein